jgi:predicted Ser/Thr protein kinase/tetratricopeptide (TPR) repeat protein
MSLDREARLDEWFHRALALPPEQRDAFLGRQCAQDPDLRALVKRLLRYHDAPGPVDLDRPALAHLAESMRADATPPGDGLEDSLAIEPAADLPRRFGDYRLLRELGRGGMGVVYLARQLSANRPVAVKILSPHMLEDLPAGRREQAVRRFRAEAEAMARLTHEHIVTVYEVGACDGRHYYAMRYVEGRSLAEMVRKRPLDGRAAAPLLERVARAVHHAHGQGLLHRDLTPGNILLDRDNRPFVADFGLVKVLESASDLTRTGEFLGTPGYIAPEQADDPARASPASDVYSLGATLYHVLTGRPPFQAATVAETLRQVRADEPVPPRTVNPSVPRDLETICLKCLEKETKRRYVSCAQFADDLGRWQRGEPIRARPVRLPERCWRWCRRRPALAALAAVSAALLLVILVGLAVTMSLWRQAEASEAQARKSAALAVERQRDAEANFAKALELIVQVVSVAEKSQPQTADQNLAVEMLRGMANVSGRFAGARSPDAEGRYRLADVCLGVGHILRSRGGTPAESLSQLELARQLLEGLVREAPGDLRFLVRLGDAWYQLGQTRRIMGRHDEALAAYRQSVQMLRTAFKHAPDKPEYRKKLSLQYGRLAYWLRERGCLAEAAANLLEQKQLWPGDAGRLSEIAENLSYLALLVGDGRTELTPAEWSEFQRYLDLSEQVEREATAAKSRAGRAKS